MREGPPNPEYGERLRLTARGLEGHRWAGDRGPRSDQPHATVIEPSGRMWSELSRAASRPIHEAFGLTSARPPLLVGKATTVVGTTARRFHPALRALVAVLLVANVLFTLLALSPRGLGVQASVAAAAQSTPTSRPTTLPLETAGRNTGPLADVGSGEPTSAPTVATVPTAAASRTSTMPPAPTATPSATAAPTATPTPAPTATPVPTEAPLALLLGASLPPHHFSPSIPDIGGPAPAATGTPTPTTTPNPFAGDDLTNIAKVPDAQAIVWAAYVPVPAATPVPGVKGTGIFIWPVEGWITTQFQPTHLAIDIAGSMGSPVVASDTGTVVFAGIDYGGLGYAVEIDHGNGYVTAYGHNSVLKVTPGQIVRRGDLIALRGSTGHSTGPHVHFGIHFKGQPVSPIDLLRTSAPAAPVPQLAVPKLLGLSQAKVQAALKNLPLQVTYDPPQPSAVVPAGLIVMQQPAVGDLADMNSTIHLALSSGPPTPSPTATATPTPTPRTAGTNTPAPSTSPVATPTTKLPPTGRPGTASLTPTSSAEPPPTPTPSPKPVPSPTVKR